MRREWLKGNAGIGTMVSMMLPDFLILTVLWTLFLVAWYRIGIPLGPSAAAHT